MHQHMRLPKFDICRVADDAELLLKELSSIKQHQWSTGVVHDLSRVIYSTGAQRAQLVHHIVTFRPFAGEYIRKRRQEERQSAQREQELEELQDTKAKLLKQQQLVLSQVKVARLTKLMLIR